MSDRPLPKIVIKLGWISFFADICSEMAYPVLPLFLIGVLKAPASVLGMVEGLAEATVSFMKGWSGRHSDRKGDRVPYVQWGYGISSIAKPLIGFATGWPLVLFARVLDRVGKGVRTTARDAMIADSVHPGQYGRAYGFHRAMDTAGAFFGVAITLAFLWLLPGNYRLILLVAVFPGIASFFLTLSLRDAGKADPHEIHDEPNGGKPQTWKQVISSLDGAYWRALVLSLLFALANTSDSFLLLYVKGLGFSDAMVILAYMLFNLVVVLLSVQFGSLSDRIGRWNVLFVGWLVYGAVYVLLALAIPGLSFALFALYGVYYSLSQGVGRALVADHCPKESRGSAMGLFYMLTGLATLLGNIAMGLLWDRNSPEIALRFMGIIAILAALLIPATRFGLTRRSG